MYQSLLYHTGQSENARMIYEQYEYALNDIRKKRLVCLINKHNQLI